MVRLVVVDFTIKQAAVVEVEVEVEVSMTVLEEEVLAVQAVHPRSLLLT